MTMATCLLVVATCLGHLGLRVAGSVAQTHGPVQAWMDDARISPFPVLPNVAPGSDSVACKSDSEAYLTGLKNRSLWAMQMWDSSVKAPVGVFSGTIFHLGNFDECLRTSSPFPVKFCVARVTTNVTTATNQTSAGNTAWEFIKETSRDSSKAPRSVLHWGLCLPASCERTDLEKSINFHLTSVNSENADEVTYGVAIDERMCTVENESEPFTVPEITFWIFVLTAVALTLTSTLLDFADDDKDTVSGSRFRLFLNHFSGRRNFPSIFPREKSEKSFVDVFHGVKFMSIIVIVFAHRAGIGLSVSALNFDEVETKMIDNQKMFFIQSDLVVDTFFFISGLLTCYTTMTILNKVNVNPVQAILFRFIRLAPLYYVVIWFQSSAASRLGSGPLWKAIAKGEVDFCVKNWWLNALFVNNYFRTREMCMPHSWFLACELHFFIVAAFLIPVFCKRPTLGKILLALIIFASAAIPGIVIYLTGTHPMVLFYYKFLAQPRQSDSFNTLYIKSHSRAAVYFIGTAAGWFLHSRKRDQKKLSQKTILGGVLVWLSLLFAPMAYGALYYDVGRPFSRFEAAVFGSLRRISWALGFTVFALVHRFGTIPVLDVLFSSRVAVFLSRITYGIYLLHYNFIVLEVASTRTVQEFNTRDLVSNVFADLLKAGFASFVFQLILEIPLKKIIRDLIQPEPIKSADTNLETRTKSTENHIVAIRL